MTFQQLPADILREIVKDLPVREILHKCTLDRGFNQAVCNSISFWQQLGISRDIPRHLLENKDLAGLKRKLLEWEEWNPIVYDVNAMLYKNPQDIPDLNYNPFSLLRTYYSENLETVLKDLSAYQQMGYDNQPDYHQHLVDPIIFKERLKSIDQNIRSLDVIQWGPIYYHTSYIFHDYLLGGERYRRLRALHRAYQPTNEVLFNEELFMKLSQLNNQQPLTREIIHDMYPYPINSFIRSLAEVAIGSKQDPIQTIEGIPFHAIK